MRLLTHGRLLCDDTYSDGNFLLTPPYSGLQPHQVRTPFQDVPTTLYCSLAFFMSLPIVVCELRTSESLNGSITRSGGQDCAAPLVCLLEEQRSEVSLQPSDSPGSWKDG